MWKAGRDLVGDSVRIDFRVILVSVWLCGVALVSVCGV